MSHRRRLATLLALLSSATALQAQGPGSDLKACRQLTDAAARLACYDAVALPSEPGAAAAPNAAPTLAEQTAAFGREAVKAAPSAPPPLDRIESRIPGTFTGWEPNGRVTLENGQVWRIADGSEAMYNLTNPKATVQRSLLGAYFLQVEGVSFQAKVVRVR
jgi:hypothetical protein